MMMQSCGNMTNSAGYCVSYAAAGTSVRAEILDTVVLAVSIIISLLGLLVLLV